MNSFESRFKKNLKIMKYLWAHFHNYFLTAICVLLVLVYYLYCTFSRYCVDTDVYIGNLIRADYGILGTYNIRNNSSKSIAKFGSINCHIDKKNYKEAIELIEGIKNMLGDRTMLHRYLLMRQALLTIYVSSSKEEYETYLKNHQLLLGKEVIESLIYTYELCREN